MFCPPAPPSPTPRTDPATNVRGAPRPTWNPITGCQDKTALLRVDPGSRVGPRRGGFGGGGIGRVQEVEPEWEGPLGGAANLGQRIGAGHLGKATRPALQWTGLPRAVSCAGRGLGRGSYKAARPPGSRSRRRRACSLGRRLPEGSCCCRRSCRCRRWVAGRSTRAPWGGSALGAPRPGRIPVPTGGAELRGRQLRPLGPVSWGIGVEGGSSVPAPPRAGVGRFGPGGRPGPAPPAPGAAVPQVPAPGPLEQPVARGVSGGRGAHPGARVHPGPSPPDPHPACLCPHPGPLTGRQWGPRQPRRSTPPPPAFLPQHQG